MNQGYNFKATRDRIEFLTAQYRQLARTQEKDGSWDWYIASEIECLEMEIAEAHRSTNAKMTTVASSGHPILQNILVTPMVPQWQRKEQDGILL
ncbi:hypothetical protein GCM10023310_00570 [Paenibacillus vulneris]|uniref:Uncharacterized protein n=1 Tax=Paenibacillus vulneris TaxID=1133364 RepID=A0ABW3UXG6_9BACL